MLSSLAALCNCIVSASAAMQVRSNHIEEKGFRAAMQNRGWIHYTQLAYGIGKPESRQAAAPLKKFIVFIGSVRAASPLLLLLLLEAR